MAPQRAVSVTLSLLALVSVRKSCSRFYIISKFDFYSIPQ